MVIIQYFALLDKGIYKFFKSKDHPHGVGWSAKYKKAISNSGSDHRDRSTDDLPIYQSIENTGL